MMSKTLIKTSCQSVLGSAGLIHFTILLVSTLIFTANVHAQYKLQKAFPNLPPFSYPVELTNANDGTNRLFLVQQKGLIYTFNNNPNVSTRKIFLDLTHRVDQSPVTGLFGLAFHPDYKSNRYIYTHYVFDSLGGPINKWIKISRFQTSSANPDTVLPGTEVNLITVSLMRPEHNGGKIAFGADGLLYISIGDASIGGDSARSLSSLLGKVLRINVDVQNERLNYSIPKSNPFYNNTEGYREEIFAYGLRNPWKFSIDFPTNRIFLGDVGSARYEEINLLESGKDYGWNKMEGFHCYPYPPFACDTTGYGLTRPIWEYSLFPFGQAVTGGYVYRGSLLPDLYGKYIYGDYIDAKIWSMTYDGINPTTNSLLFDTNFYLVSFGVDESNELYVCSYSETSPDGTIFKLYNSNVITLNINLIVEGFYNPILNKLNMSDTVTAYLHSSTSPFSVVDSSKNVIDKSNFGGLYFFKNASSATYFIRLKHRNSVETWSKPGGMLLTRGGLFNYDFTTAKTQAYGLNMTLVNNGPVKYAIYSGDVDRNGVIDLTDLSIIYNSASLYASGYALSDLTGDSSVDLSDILIVSNNSAGFVSRIIP